jgi:NtrC-family two-component system sensor histidine kinase KinB
MFTTLRAKLFSGFLLILLLLIALGGYAILSFRGLADITSSGLEQNSESVIANLSMYESLVRMDAAQLHMLAGEQVAAGKDVLIDEPPQFYDALQRAKAASAGTAPEVRQTVGSYLLKMEIEWDAYQSKLLQFVRLSNQSRTSAHSMYDSSLAPQYARLKDISLSLSEQYIQAFRVGKSNVVTRAQKATLGVLLVTIIAVILGVVGSYVIARNTIRPLRELTDTVKGLQAGHLDARIPIRGADEIGDLGFEFNRLTERLRQFEAMNINQILQEKRKSEAIIESIEDPLLLFDAGGQLLLMNHAAEAITGITEQTALGRPLRQLFRDKNMLRDIDRALEQAAHVLKNEERIDPPIVSIPHKGRVRYFRLRVGRIISSQPTTSSANVQEEAQPIVGVLVFFTDITHFKELDKLKSDFIAKVSHEFRTPLTSMTMALDILHAGILGVLNPEQRDIIATSKGDAERLAKLIRDLLTLARLESTSQRPESPDELLDVAETLVQLIRSLRPMYLEKGVELRLSTPEDLILVMPSEHLASIISNLLSNALKFTPTGGEVRVHVAYEKEREELELSVTDTGIGIIAEDQKRIFDKFVQVKPTNFSTPGSVGLGLAIVTEITSRYRGSVQIESMPGKGSTFRVRLIVAEFESANQDAVKTT